MIILTIILFCIITILYIKFKPSVWVENIILFLTAVETIRLLNL